MNKIYILLVIVLIASPLFAGNSKTKLQCYKICKDIQEEQVQQCIKDKTQKMSTCIKQAMDDKDQCISDCLNSR
jgi:DNA gyrase/topoisomerase IV subunit B